MINIFVLGKKGLESVSEIDPTLFSSINALIIGKDTGVVNDYSDEIVAFAQKNNIRYFLRSEADEQAIAEGKLNIAIGWRWLISLSVPLIVFHDSILPQYRGFNPLVSALINGDNEIGVTALIGTDEFDKGDIIGQRIIKITYPIKIEAAIELLSKQYALLLEEVMTGFLNNTLKGIPQDENNATFSLWRDEEDYHIDWNQDATTIKRTIDAVGFPYKGTFAYMEDAVVRIFDAEIVEDVSIINRTPGKVLFRHEDGLVIVCGKGLLKVRDFFNDNGEQINNMKFRIRFK
jgi:methionyl-tRNA formyltransferase